MANKPEEQNAPKMISKGPNKLGIDWGPKSPVIYTSVTESDPNLQQVPALGVQDEEEVPLMISHTDGQIVIDILDDRYESQMLVIEKCGGKLQACVWASFEDLDGGGMYFTSSPYIIDFKETEPEEAK
tara:strand:+ start:294 stop:677 length:384 start_codon:yes stop_codon:yes gene_type:complete